MQDPPPPPLPAAGWGMRSSSPWQEQESTCSEGIVCNYNVCLSPLSPFTVFSPACQGRNV